MNLQISPQQSNTNTESNVDSVNKLNLNLVLTEKERQYLILITEKLKMAEQQLNQDSNKKSPPKQDTTRQNISDQKPIKNINEVSQFSQRSPYRSLSPSRVTGPYYQTLNEKENCTFHPKINNNANKLSKRDMSASNGEDYFVKYLYGDALNRVEKDQQKKKLIDQQESNLKNQSKIDSQSQRIILKKIEKTLNQFLEDIDEVEDMAGCVNFENLGFFLQNLGIFKVLKFKKTSNNETSLYLNDTKKIDIERLKKETKFHEQLWSILTIRKEDIQGVSKKQIFDTVMILLEKKLSIEQSISLLMEVLYIHYMQEKQNNESPPQIEEESDILKEEGTQQTENTSYPVELKQIFENPQNQDDWNLEMLIIQFRKLIDDKTNSMTWYSSNMSQILEKIEPEQEEQKMFSPQINRKSKEIDQSVNDNYIMKKMKSSISGFCQKQVTLRTELLYEHSKYLQEKKEEITQKKNHEEMKNCTFKPETNSKNKDSNVKKNEKYVQKARYQKLYDYAKQKDCRIQEQIEQSEFLKQQKEQQECSFQPEIQPIYKNYDNSQDKSFYDVRGTRETIERMTKGREKKQVSDLYWKSKEESWQNHDVNKFTYFSPFSFFSREKSIRDRGESIGFVDVNFQKGKKGRINVFRGDEADVLAANFARIYSLNQDMQLTLQELLHKYIQDLNNQEKSNQRIDDVPESFSQQEGYSEHLQ